jgi:quercetin 2,3-dioxygenase
MKKLLRILPGAEPHWVGDGFPVRSVFSYLNEGTAVSPFLLLDYAGPVTIEPTETPRGVEAHPHKGFETVTIVYQGEVEHRDSTGASGRIGPGDVQWMTAASGILHEEKHGREFSRQGGTLEMAQLWVNLPARDKGAPPGYQTLTADTIPTVVLLDENIMASATGAGEAAGTARIIAGELNGMRGPARTFTPLHVWDLRLNAGHTVELPVPDGWTATLFVPRGEVTADGQTVGELSGALFETAGVGIRLSARRDATVLLLSGEPLSEPIVGYGPFVMNTRTEIMQAVEDYRSGRMGRLDSTQA